MAYKQIRRRTRQELGENERATPQVSDTSEVSQIQTDRELMTADDAMALQDLVGNRATGQLMGAASTPPPPPRTGYVQPKPLIEQPRKSSPHTPAYARFKQPIQQASAPKVQRKMAFKLSDLAGSLTTKAKLAGLFGKTSTFAQIQKLLGEYEKEANPFKSQSLLMLLKELGNKWLTDHGASKDAGDVTKAKSIRAMLLEVDTELLNAPSMDTELAKAPTPEEQKKYMKDITGGKFKFLSHSGKSAAMNTSDSFGLHDASSEAKKYGMSEAELAGVRIYTAQDYKYMNPVLAGSEGWLNAKVSEMTSGNEWSFNKKTLTPAQKLQLQGEAIDHTRMAVAGLAKLPDWTGKGYRGLALPEADVLRDYANGKTISFAPFTSTSTNSVVSLSFAELEANNSKGTKVAVLLELNITKGKDVDKISANPGESEVLLAPGSKFVVAGTPVKTDGVYHVKVRQTA